MYIDILLFFVMNPICEIKILYELARFKFRNLRLPAAMVSIEDGYTVKRARLYMPSLAMHGTLEKP